MLPTIDNTVSNNRNLRNIQQIPVEYSFGIKETNTVINAANVIGTFHATIFDVFELKKKKKK